MNLTHAAGVVVLLAAVFFSGYAVGLHDGRQSGAGRGVANLKQVGLAFRHGRNDLASPFNRSD